MSNSMDALAGALGLDEDESDEDFLDSDDLVEEVDNTDEVSELDEVEAAFADLKGHDGVDSEGYDVWNGATGHSSRVGVVADEEDTFEEDTEESAEVAEAATVEYSSPFALLLKKSDPEEAETDEGESEDDEGESGYTEVDPAISDLDSTIPSASDVLGTNAAQALSSEFGIDSDSYVLRHGQVTLGEIATLDPLRKSRNRSAKGLTQSVKELGIVNPIHVMVTESYSDWLADDSEEIFTGNKYVLLDGFRRMYGAIKNGISEVEAVIWEFNDPDYGNEVSLVLALLINKRQRRVWEETWNLFQVLEMRSAMSPSTLEYLLELDSGDAMKLKDVAMATTYPEVWMSLLSDEKSLDQAYNVLKKLRKEEDKAQLEDERGISDFEDSEGIVGDHSNEDISDEEVRKILEISNNNELGAFDFVEDGEEMLGMEEGDLQSTSERKPLDPVLRQAILRRDNFTCQVCRLGEGVNSGIALGTFEIHHTASVMAGLDASRDDVGNISPEIDIPKLITLCSADHRLVHLIVRHDGKLGITKEEFEVIPEHMQIRWKEAGKLAKVLLWAEKKSGKKAQRAENLKLPTHKPFWEQEKENTDALKLGSTVETYGREYAPTVEEIDDGDGEE